jgi:hypothetical protein
VLTAFAAAHSTPASVVAIPLVIVLQRSLRHASLAAAARTDAKTGLLNAGAWQRETAVQVTRARACGVSCCLREVLEEAQWGMTSGRKPAATPPTTPVQAGRGEHWWPVALAIVVAAFLHVALPAKYRVNPAWVVPAVLLALLAALIIGDPGRIDEQKRWLRIVTGAVIAFLTVANLLAAIHLFHDILTNNKLFASNATGLLATGGVLWATNVIAFALWYWDLDRGGAAARAHHPQANPAFIFPEMLHTQYVPATWVPKFVDYLSLGFWTATAFSPTDISAIKPWAKLLMIIEAAVSLGIAGLVIARAINILA